MTWYRDELGSVWLKGVLSGSINMRCEAESPLLKNDLCNADKIFKLTFSCNYVSHSVVSQQVSSGCFFFHQPFCCVLVSVPDPVSWVKLEAIYAPDEVWGRD